jgi:hypothetical protein
LFRSKALFQVSIDVAAIMNALRALRDPLDSGAIMKVIRKEPESETYNPAPTRSGKEGSGTQVKSG